MYGNIEMEQGNTSPPARPAWVLEGNHTELEDALLDQIDVERGHVVAVVRAKLAPERRKHSLGQDYEVTADRRMESELLRFMDALSEKMIAEYEPALATRAYAVARPLQMKLRDHRRLYSRAYLNQVHFTVTHEGAHALLVELREYLKAFEGESNPLRPLLAALRDGRKLAKGGK